MKIHLHPSLQSRKLWMATLAFIVACVALFLKLATFSEWTTAVEWLIGLYSVGNVADKIVTKPKEDRVSISQQ